MALSIVPIGGTVGLSVDLGRAYLAKSLLQEAVDAAALAGARQYHTTNSAASANAAARSVFDANASARLSGAAPVIAMNTSTKTMSVSATYDVNTSFIRIVAPTRNATTVKATADAVIQNTGLAKNLEVSVMLDVSVSMGQSSGSPGLTKLQAMQSAAKNLIDTVVQTSQTPYASRVALAPYSSAVNVGGYFNAVTGTAPVGAWKSVVERAGAFNATQDPPSTNFFPSFKNMQSSVKGQYVSYVKGLSNSPLTATIQPLSTNKTALKSSIDAFTTDGTTAGQIGTAWSWYLLSPNWSGVFTGASAPAAYSSDVSKVVVLMSDFDYNTYYQSGVGDMNAQAAALCANMKAAGVTVYTIGFQVDHNLANSVSLFQGCASDATKAIEATNGTELIAAFQNVADTVVANVSSSIRLAR